MAKQKYTKCTTIADVIYKVIEMKQSIAKRANAVSAEKSKRQGRTEWERRSTVKCARNLYLTIRTSGTCATLNLSLKTFSEIFRDERII